MNVTLCFSAGQALLAAKAGAYIISPFVGRLDDIGWTGMDLIRSITTIYKNYGYKTQVLAASLRSPTHVIDAAMAGAHIGTMPFKVLDMLFNHPLTDKGLEQFLKDYDKVFQETPGRRLGTTPETMQMALANLLSSGGTMLTLGGGAAVAGLGAWGIYRYIKSRPSPAELERRRRADLRARGKMGDANLLEFRDTMVMYSYAIGGVEYTASQDLSDLATARAGGPLELHRAGVHQV